MLHLLRTCDTVWSDGWPRLLCNSSNDVLIAAIVISLKKVGVVTTMLSLQGTIDYWGCEEWVFKLSNTYGPPLSWPLGRTILVVRSLKKQEVGCNSKYTRLSLANLKTLSRFLEYEAIVLVQVFCTDQTENENDVVPMWWIGRPFPFPMKT